MPLSNAALPYGIRDIKLTAYTDAAGTTLATSSIDLPNARTLAFSDTEEFQELRGDDKVAAVHGTGPNVTWNLEAGGLPFEAFKIMAGGTVTDSGVTPNLKRVFSKKTTDQRPYFRVEGQAISDSGGDVHVVLHRCKATGNLEGSFSDGEFFLTAADGRALGMESGPFTDEVYRFEYNETVVNIAGVVPAISAAYPTGAAATDVITILGSGFTGATAVKFGATSGTGLVVVSDSIINVALPAGSAGSVNVTVVTPAGTSTALAYTRA